MGNIGECNCIIIKVLLSSKMLQKWPGSQSIWFVIYLTNKDAFPDHINNFCKPKPKG
jgi:hypothetical protein